MLYLSDLYKRILIKTGQFALRENLEISVELFPLVVEEALYTFNTYCPRKEIRFLDFTYRREYCFSEGEGIPEKITDMVPFGNLGSLYLFNQERLSSNSLGGLSIPSHRPFIYQKPVLTVAVSSNYQVTCMFNHELEELEVEGEGEFKKPGFRHLNGRNLEPDFIKLIAGHFMQAIGRARRSFQLQDVPFTMDADQQVQEGEQMVREAEDNLKENHSQFYDAYY